VYPRTRLLCLTRHLGSWGQSQSPILPQMGDCTHLHLFLILSLLKHSIKELLLDITPKNNEMKKIIYPLIFILLVLNIQHVFSQGFEWANQVELVANDNVATILPLGKDTEKDAEGNVYMAGSFAGTQKFGDKTLTSRGIGGIIFTDDGFIAKYAPTGEFLRVESFPATGFGLIHDIAIDDLGNIYTLTIFRDSINIAGTEIIADEAFVVAKMDANFNLIWHKTILREGSGNHMFPGALELSANDVIITGSSSDEVTLDGVILNESFPIILVSLDNQNGNLNWFDNLGYERGDLATDASGNIYWAFNYPIAQIPNPIQISNISVNSINGPVMLLLKYDTQGNILSAKAFGNGGNNPNTINQVEVNETTGDIYLAGTWGDTLDIDGIKMTSQISASTGGILWLAKYNSNEEVQWIRRNHLPPNVSGNIFGQFMRLDSSPDGSVFISSETSNNTDFVLGEGVNAISFTNTVDGFVAKYAANGNLAWGQKLDCILVNCALYIRGLTALDNNQVALTGSFSHQFDLGDLSLTGVFPGTNQQPNIYLIKVNGDFITPVNNIKINQSLVQIYPNPVNDFLQIEIPSEHFRNGQIEIFDLFGKALLQTNLNQNTHQLSVSNFPNGTYLLSITGDHMQTTQKFIIQK